MTTERREVEAAQRLAVDELARDVTRGRLSLFPELGDPPRAVAVRMIDELRTRVWAA
jgi:hypothetical protein